MDAIADLLQQAGYEVTPTEDDLKVQGKRGPIYVGVTDEPAQVYILATFSLMGIPPGLKLLLVNFFNREAELASFHLAPASDAVERLSLDYNPEASTMVARLVLPVTCGVHVAQLLEALRRFELDVNEAVLLSRRDGLVSLTPPDVDHGMGQL